MIAHVSGVPVEELVPLAGTGLLALGTWIRVEIRARMKR